MQISHRSSVRSKRHVLQLRRCAQRFRLLNSQRRYGSSKRRLNTEPVTAMQRLPCSRNSSRQSRLAGRRTPRSAGYSSRMGKKPMHGCTTKWRSKNSTSKSARLRPTCSRYRHLPQRIAPHSSRRFEHSNPSVIGYEQRFELSRYLEARSPRLHELHVRHLVLFHGLPHCSEAQEIAMRSTLPEVEGTRRHCVARIEETHPDPSRIDAPDLRTLDTASVRTWCMTRYVRRQAMNHPRAGRREVL